MEIHFLSTFPDMLRHTLQESILGRAEKKKLISFHTHDLRTWTHDTHRTTDDRPYGGGPGMVMRIEPIAEALDQLGFRKGTAQELIGLTSAKGELFTQQTAQAWSQNLHRILFICGHYEGVDERVAEHLVDCEMRVGDYVLTGGELPALLMADAVTRLLPGVLGDSNSLQEESHSTPGYMEYPHYTRPATFRGWSVPGVLQQGNHAEITAWREQHGVKPSPDQ